MQEYQNKWNPNGCLQRNKGSWKNFWLPFRSWVIWLNANEKSGACKKMTGDSPELFNLQAVRKHNWMHFWIYLESAHLHEKQAHENHWIQTEHINIEFSGYLKLLGLCKKNPYLLLEWVHETVAVGGQTSFTTLILWCTKFSRNHEKSTQSLEVIGEEMVGDHHLLSALAGLLSEN